jgi:hypothetical protein
MPVQAINRTVPALIIGSRGLWFEGSVSILQDLPEASFSSIL